MTDKQQNIIIPERLALVTALRYGAHKKNDNANWCAMEAVAYIAGEPWSDSPQCASPVIAAFMRAWNDSLPVSYTHLTLPTNSRV